LKSCPAHFGEGFLIDAWRASRLPCRMKAFSVLLCLVASFLHAEDAAFPKQAIATVHRLATQAGKDAFAKGGNAIDAAIAAGLTLGVVDGHNSGIGGGCFFVIRAADGNVTCIDGREMAPAMAHRDMYVINGKLDDEASKTGALASGVPGYLKACAAAQT
jgi:gamma-glutamyltranspeptidase/glutathione hydrolase